MIYSYKAKKANSEWKQYRWLPNSSYISLCTLINVLSYLFIA